MRQTNDPFYVPDQLSQQIEEENNCRLMQKNKLINEQREFYQEYLKRKDMTRKGDIPAFKIGQENPLPRKQHKTVDELNNNVCTNLTKDNIYTQQRKVDQVAYSKRHERDNRNYNIINMAPSERNQQQYGRQIVDGHCIDQYDQFKHQNVVRNQEKETDQRGYNQYTPTEEKGYYKENEVNPVNIPRGQLANQYDINDDSKTINLTEEERRKYVAYLEYLNREEMKIKQMKENYNNNEGNQDRDKDFNADQYIEPLQRDKREMVDLPENQYQFNKNDMNSHQMQQRNPQIQSQSYAQPIPSNHYHKDTVKQFNQNPNTKLIETPYVENYYKINNYYQNQMPIKTFNQPLPPYGVDNQPYSGSFEQRDKEIDLIEQKKKLDLQEEARREYLSNKMKNVSTYTNLTHMTSLNPSLKCQPIQPPVQSTSTQPSTQKIKQQQYKHLLDEQMQARQQISPDDKLINPYSKPTQRQIGESALANNPISQPYPSQQFKR